MSTISICYGTTDGHTAEVARFIADVVLESGHRALLVDLKTEAADALAGADAVMIGASIHVNTHPEYVVDFVRAQAEALADLPSAFFSVSLSATGDPAQANRYIEDFCTATGWQPTETLAVAGAIRYTSYGVFKRQLMKQIAKDRGLSTNTRADASYTDWPAVKAFTERFVAQAVTPAT